VYGISNEKAVVLLKKVMASDQIVSKQTQHVISVTAKEISHKESLIKAEKEYLEKLYNTNSKVKLIASIPGIGMSSAIILLLQIEDVKRFETSKKMASYFGVNPMFKQSGDGIWGNHMSKKGRGEIRATLYMTALTAVRCNPLLKTLYRKHRTHGFNHYQAMGVGMHKLLRIIYGILKNETPFDSKIDESNVQRSTTKQKQIEEFTKEKISIQNKKQSRFMTYSEDAPISRRKHQKNQKASSVPIQKNLELAGLLDA
jgi:transposase